MTDEMRSTLRVALLLGVIWNIVVALGKLGVVAEDWSMGFVVGGAVVVIVVLGHALLRLYREQLTPPASPPPVSPPVAPRAYVWPRPIPGQLELPVAPKDKP